MKARIVRFDTHYEVGFSRPAFSRISSFSHIDSFDDKENYLAVILRIVMDRLDLNVE